MDKDATPRLFFIQQRPDGHIKREWVRPADEAAYHNLLKAEGFLSPSDHDLYGPLLQKAVIVQDLNELENHLLPVFWQKNQAAKFYRNRYYQYEWLSILSAFFVVSFATVSIYFFAQNWSERMVIEAIRPTELLGLLASILAGAGASVRFLAANQTPWRRWIENQRTAEELRSLYFKYLTHTPPFDSEKRVVGLHKQAKYVASEGALSVPEVPYYHPQFMALLDKNTAVLLSEFYSDRIESHLRLFSGEIIYLQYNADRLIGLEAGLAGVTAIIASYSVISDRPFSVFILVLLTAFAVTILLFRKLYQFEENITFYKQVWTNLDQLRLSNFQGESHGDEETLNRLVIIVEQVETLITLALNQRR